MRLLAGCAAGWFLLLLCLAARAEGPFPAGPEFAPLPVSPAPAPPADEISAPDWVSAHVLLGQQLGIRAQVMVAQQSRCTYVVEGFYGGLLTKFGASEGAGGGGRVLFRRTSHDGNNSLLLGPGVNLLYQFDDGGLLMLAPSVDLSWLHGFGSGGGWEIGLIAGLGVSLMDERHGDVTAGQVTPLISVYTGFRF